MKDITVHDLPFMTPPKSNPFDYVGSGLLTKREYFAAMAMQAFCGVMGPIQTDPKRCAEQAVIHADALIEALNKE